MDLKFNDPELQECADVFDTIAPEERPFMNHYELAEHTTITDTNRWKTFLSNPSVVDWMRNEIKIFQDVQLRKVLRDAADDKRSVGAAQMINALNKSIESSQSKEGAVFIYMHVPLNDNEVGAPDVTTLPRNIFKGD